MKYERIKILMEMKENGATERQLNEFISLTEMQFELWYNTCYKK